MRKSLEKALSRRQIKESRAVHLQIHSAIPAVFAHRKLSAYDCNSTLLVKAALMVDIQYIV